MSGCKRDEVERRHPPDWRVVVGERCKQICGRRFNLISNLRDLPQQGFPLFSSLQTEGPLAPFPRGRHQLTVRRRTYIVVVATPLSAERRLVVELVFEIVLTQVPQSRAHLSVLQLLLK